jgi:hypothetical protein
MSKGSPPLLVVSHLAGGSVVGVGSHPARAHTSQTENSPTCPTPLPIYTNNCIG